MIKEGLKQESAEQKRYDSFVLSMMPAFMVQPEIKDEYLRAKAEMDEWTKNIFKPFSPEEEMKARKEFEDMILSTVNLPANQQAQAENVSEEFSAEELEKLMFFGFSPRK